MEKDDCRGMVRCKSEEKEKKETEEGFRDWDYIEGF